MTRSEQDSVTDVVVDQRFHDLVKRLERRRFTAVRLDAEFLRGVAERMGALVEGLIGAEDRQSVPSDEP